VPLRKVGERNSFVLGPAFGNPVKVCIALASCLAFALLGVPFSLVPHHLCVGRCRGPPRSLAWHRRTYRGNKKHPRKRAKVKRWDGTREGPRHLIVATHLSCNKQLYLIATPCCSVRGNILSAIVVSASSYKRRTATRGEERESSNRLASSLV
jgi:hypothetical protein